MINHFIWRITCNFWECVYSLAQQDGNTDNGHLSLIPVRFLHIMLFRVLMYLSAPVWPMIYWWNIIGGYTLILWKYIFIRSEVKAGPSSQIIAFLCALFTNDSKEYSICYCSCFLVYWWDCFYGIGIFTNTY